MISSIAEDTSLTPQQRQERIGNFDKLLEDAEKKLHFNGDVNEDALMLDEGRGVNRRGRIAAPKEKKDKYKMTKMSLLGRLRHKSKSKGNNVNDRAVGRNSELETVSEERQDEVRNQEYQESSKNKLAEKLNREEAPKEPSADQQPSNIFIPATPVPPPEGDEVTHADSIMDMRAANSEDYTASVCSIRSLGTFEKDFINNIINEQQAMEEISVSTFEQDAGMVRSANVAPPNVVAPLQQEFADEDDLTLDSLLSETTFERDARKTATSQTIVPPVQVKFSNNNAAMMPEENNDIEDDDLSETTFEQDHKTVMTDMVPQPYLQAATSEGSLRSVSTFEKDAAARAQLALKIGRIPSTKPKVQVMAEVSSEGTFEKDQRVRQALSEHVASASGQVAKMPVQSVVQSESATVYEREVNRKSKENHQQASQQLLPYKNDDGESRFEKDVSRNMTAHAVKIVAVPHNPAPLPRINDLVVELSPEEVQKQQRQLERRRNSNGGVLSRFMCHCGLGEKQVKLSLEKNS